MGPAVQLFAVVMNESGQVVCLSEQPGTDLSRSDESERVRLRCNRLELVPLVAIT